MRAWLIVLFVVGACARPSLPARLLAHPPPAAAGVVRTVGSFRGATGTVLFEQCWRPRAGKPRAVLTVVHGIKDHSGRYNAMATHLVRAGIAVCGFDHRGHGRSAGPRFDIHSFANVTTDIHRYLVIVRKRFPGLPVFLFGHSMGGVLVPLYVLVHRPALAGVVLSAPAVRPVIHPYQIAALLAVARVLPNAPLVDTPNDTFSPDPEVVAAMGRDPFIYQGKGTGRTGVELVNGIHRVWADAHSFVLPLLLLHGTADHAVRPQGSVELLARVGSRDKTLHLYPGAGHDLAHDPQRQKVYRDIQSWILARLP